MSPEQADSGYRRNLYKALVERNITTPEQIKKGLETARKQTTPWLPSVGEFASWCKASAPYHKEFKDSSPDEIKRLALLATSKEDTAAWIEKCRKHINND